MHTGTHNPVCQYIVLEKVFGAEIFICDSTCNTGLLFIWLHISYNPTRGTLMSTAIVGNCVRARLGENLAAVSSRKLLP